MDTYEKKYNKEQPEVDLEEEMTSYIERNFHIRNDETLEVGNDPLTTHDFEEIARHFYDLGCRRTAEKADEIEYNRQRAEESVPNDLEEAAKEYEDALGYYECMSQWPGVAFIAEAKWQK